MDVELERLGGDRRKCSVLPSQFFLAERKRHVLRHDPAQPVVKVMLPRTHRLEDERCTAANSSKRYVDVVSAVLDFDVRCQVCVA
ncbi:hypothetical protein PHYSODRAFT_353611 [Phytophthora sojae]|uniref:Uncharacterized protein n=1 Tax=Phytophthora sojae (strain P6497) TaxID=1094619 RepID=G4YHL4_PHYSP|nr:hypothetical protein PHYSODRAFT_353611 [Phytophthora sojae]EGZ29119.1 hypothetical protein PHYSODRAFT_353611 [Phytophthora sojae]|eukprot:XP_009516394.1 hypothetical protein PHYSODRAFT_353611 [Phytophthora sojae]